MNIVQILGNLGADPETRYAPSGQKITNLRVASNTRRGGKDETTWWRVTIFGDRFDKLISYLKKGSSVIVVGKMNAPSIWTDKEGRPQVTLEVIADMVEFSPFGRTDRPAGEQAQGQGGSYTPGYTPGQPAYSQHTAPSHEPSYASGGGFGSTSYGSQKPSEGPEEETIPF